ncbi:MAG: ABC transporter permease subunit, partial [Lachnospiraceae bacterium]|nr:ABC transporter permease subunit [Lachnospiraceae bacterium]
SFFMVMPVFYSNVQAGYSSIDKKMVELCDVMKLGHRDRFAAYLKPALLPSFRAASVNGIGLAWKSGIAAEIICRPHYALGTILGNGKNTLETAEVFAVTLVIIIFSMIFNMLVKRLWGGRDDNN